MEKLTNKEIEKLERLAMVKRLQEKESDRAMTLKQKQERLRKLLKQKEQNKTWWEQLEDALVISKFPQARKIQNYIKGLQKSVMGKEAKA